MFGPAAGAGSPAMIYDGFIRRWILVTHRKMVETTPMNSDAEQYWPGEGKAVVLVDGWIDSATEAVTTDVGRYNVALESDPGTNGYEAELTLRSVAADIRKYKASGWVEDLRIENPVDAPQRFSGIIRVTGDIVIQWET